jgi:glutamate-1-semialdehyde 2,1-aminomutase/spore coat polysaccharide biosynthesis protein SpsF
MTPVDSHPRVVAIIQARMSSTRFPGKVLADLCGRPVLWYVVHRLRRARLVGEIVVATSTQPADDPIAAWCAREGVACFRGSESNVLDRYYQAARAHRAAAVVRITGDCPLIDPAVVDKVIAAYLEGGADYVANILRYTYPDGLDTEVFSFAALERSHGEATQVTEREHATPYMRHSGKFRLRNVEHDVDLFHDAHRWVVDEPRDLEFMRALLRELNGKAEAGMEEILKVLGAHPEIKAINQSIIRNEGYYLGLLNEPPVPPRVRPLSRSAEFRARAERVIPSGTQTFSKGPTQFVQGVAPNFLARGQGSHVWDVDGNEYIDYSMGLGPVILGHNDPAVTQAVTAQAAEGSAFSLPHPLEVEVAEALVRIIPCAEMVRFGKSGSDATSGAVRLARAYTGREIVACCGYHGWQDWYIGTTTRRRGVPRAVAELTRPFIYNDLASLEQIFAEHRGQVAAVILEPVGVEPPKDDFLQKVKDLAHRDGALLIFDEIITGFRLALGGAQEYFGVTPDLACFGKAIANGYPLAAVVGSRETMALFDEVFFSFTFGGEAVSLAAAAATIHEMRARNVIGHLWEQGQKLMDGYNVLARAFGVERYTRCLGLAPRTVMTFRDAEGQESLLLKSFVQQECLRRGLLFTGAHTLSASHSLGDVHYTLQVYRTVLEMLGQALAAGDVERQLEGPPVQPVFRQV